MPSDIRTYRASSLQEALELVRRDLGPDAAVLHTRESDGGLWCWITGEREIEVVASNDVGVPPQWQEGDPLSSRFTSTPAKLHDEPPAKPVRPRQDYVPPVEAEDYKSKFRE